MPEFVLEGRDEPDYQSLDGFTQGYIEALFFTEVEPGTTREQRVTPSGKVRKAWEKRQSEGQQKDMPGDYGFADLAPETLAMIIRNCRDFQKAHEALLDEAYETGLKHRTYDAAAAGRDFWFTRNGHGCGFWSREFANDSDIGDRLKEVCGWKTIWSETDVYVGDDGKVYLT